jgi:hypothetical protein
MSASVYRDRESGFYRAVCRSDECRDTNAQRNYWRTVHMAKSGAEHQAREHNASVHAEDIFVDRALRRRPQSGPVDETCEPIA